MKIVRVRLNQMSKYSFYHYYLVKKKTMKKGRLFTLSLCQYTVPDSHYQGDFQSIVNRLPR